jgi:hypothetical protein
MVNQSVIEKSKELVHPMETDGDLCPTDMVKVGNQDKEIDLKLSSSWVTNGSEVTNHKAHIPVDGIKGEGHYGRNLNSREHQEEAPTNKRKESEIGLT